MQWINIFVMEMREWFRRSILDWIFPWRYPCCASNWMSLLRGVGMGVLDLLLDRPCRCWISLFLWLESERLCLKLFAGIVFGRQTLCEWVIGSLVVVVGEIRCRWGVDRQYEQKPYYIRKKQIPRESKPEEKRNAQSVSRATADPTNQNRERY